jgi:hypothetical protein
VIQEQSTQTLQRYGLEYTRQQLTINGWRQMAIGISNRYLNKAFGAGLDGQDEEDEEEGGGGLVDSVIDLQAGHGSHVAGLVYARLFGQGDMGTMRSRDEYQRVGMQWHRFFRMGVDGRLDRMRGGWV